MTWDLVFVGGGLSSGLIAYRLKQKRPDLRVLLVEREKTLGGNHTWSFHHSDMSEEQLAWLAPFLTATWEKNEVQFPKARKTFANAYSSILSETFHHVMLRAFEGSVRLGAGAREVTARRVVLESGEEIKAGCVLDGRGQIRFDRNQVGGLQFLGLDVELEKPHGVRYPVIMDTLCDQKGSFRFFYLLPWSETSLLIEDNRYTLDLELDEEELRSEVLLYAKNKGWKVREILREEKGVLPVPLYPTFAEAGSDLSIGVGAGLFHYTTTYSVRHAVSLADELAGFVKLTPEAIGPFLRDYRARHEKRNRFYLMLNRMLLMRRDPELSYRLLERFYRMPEPLIKNFYADRMTSADRVRLMMGKPPLPLPEALQLIFRRPSSAPLS